MRKISTSAALRCGVAPALLASLFLIPAAGHAQSSGAAAEEEDAIIVTGSLIRRTDIETPSPVTILTADSLDKAGITTVSDAIRSISADSAGSIGTGFQTGFSAGGSAVSLRGLGVSSTLVLIDGLRSTNFPINDDGHNAYVDLNSIPFSLVDRIEVLKDGASSTYGADAIGGVVNLIMKKQFNGIAATAEGGVTERGDGSRFYGDLTAGWGDYDADGWNFYINGEYQRIGRISNHSRGFPFNTLDLSSIGGLDNNSADHSLTTATPSAVVVRTSQTDLNNPFAGGTAAANNAYQLLNPSCPNGSFTVTTGGAQGTGCKYDLVDRYRQLQPLQERYSGAFRFSYRVSDNVEAYLSGSFSRSYVSITSAFPAAIRATQPFGAAPSLATSNPGIVLPVWICPTGVNCADPATPGRTLNPNNPYAAAFANTPSQGAARIYYLFGDLGLGSERQNDVYRIAGGFNGTIGEDWDWRVEAVGAWDNLELTQHGLLNIAALKQAINTGAYNFVNPSSNSQAVRDAIAPDKVTPSYSSTVAIDASVTKQLGELPGGPLALAVGGQIRWEKLTNNNQNAALDTLGLTTASAFGKHTVKAAYFELNAPILDMLEVNASGRFDSYSEGFSHFSPKVGVKFSPIRQIALRATYSEGFRAPTFAESGPRSQYAGFVSTTPPCVFILQHGGTGTTDSCSANGNPYNLSYSLGRGVAGNPDVQPETSRSFTLGAIFEPVKWFSFTVDYYNVKKNNLIVAGPDVGKATAAYYAAANQAAGCAAVAAVGAGYSCNVVDAIDPLYPTALPRVLIINVPYVNANYAQTEGIDFSATAKIPLGDGIKWTSRIEATHVIRYDLVTPSGTQHYAGTLGPYDLSSGNGTPDWRGNWQNTLEVDKFDFSVTAYYVSKIKAVSEDQGLPLDCDKGNLYTRSSPQDVDPRFCYIKSFINVDANITAHITDDIRFYVNVANLFDVKAPLAAAAYTSAPNYLTTWHSAGAIGRSYKAGMSVKF